MPSKRKYFLSAIILLVIIFIAACQKQATPSPAATLPLTAAMKEVTGTVGLKQAGASDFGPAAAGMELQVNGAVQTGDDGRARLDLSTGTIIRVVPSSIFTLVSNEPTEEALTTQLKLDLGGIFVILQGGSASVTTPSGVASVRGSYLSVYVDPSTGNVIVTCLEGHCSASNSAGSVDFGAGQEVVLFTCTAGQCSVPTVGPMTPEDFAFWFNNNPDLQGIPGLAATLTAMAPTPTTQAEPTATPTPEAAVPPTEGSGGGGSACLVVTKPGSDAGLNPVGPVDFAWEPKEGASRYVLTIHYPNGASALFFTDGTSITRYMESLAGGGTYSWDITAVDASGNTICTTSATTFSKPEYVKPTPQHPQPQPSEPWPSQPPF